jgi:hypothetical protein
MSPRSTTAWMPLLVGDLRHTQVSKIDSRTAGRLLRCGISPSACRDKTGSLCAMVLNSYSSTKTNIHAHKHRFTYMGKL